MIYLPRRSDVVPFLAGAIRDGDLVLTMGAGDITMVAEAILERLRGDGSGDSPRTPASNTPAR